MTLRRQLLLVISILFLMVFVGMQTLSILATKDFLQQQLSSHAQDASTALSRSLEESMLKGDKVMVEVELATVFDRGYFQKIVVLNADGSQLTAKYLPVDNSKVPAWFSAIFVLETPPGEAFVSSGWRQLGKVVVVSQPSIAYEYLWRTTKEISWWMMTMYVLTVLLTILLLRVVLNPLLSIERVALDIQEKRFKQIDVIPATRELGRVVVAMNAMSHRISEMLDAEHAKADQYRREAYIDGVTGLDNRLAFDMNFNQLLADSGNFSQASLAVLEVDALKEFNTMFGYREGDRLLTVIGQILTQTFGDDLRIASRLGGTSLAVVTTDVPAETVQNYLKSVQLKVVDFIAQGNGAKFLAFSVGCVMFTPANVRGDIFAKLDLSIEMARQEGRNRISLLRLDDQLAGGSGSFEWRSLITKALAEKRWSLFLQPVNMLANREVFHYEVFTRLIDAQGQQISAKNFLPMALRHQLMPEVDKAIVSLVYELLVADKTQSRKLAINLSAQAIDDDEFCDWFVGLIKRAPSIATQLYVELSEFSCAKNLLLTQHFVSQLRELGVRFGIDNFGLDRNSLTLLREIPPDYIKVDGGIIREIMSNENSLGYLRSTVALAHSLQIQVVAQCVENEDLVSFLIENNVGSGQGYFFGEPQAVSIPDSPTPKNV